MGITEATVCQERNEHDLVKGFEEEIPCYFQSKKVIEIVTHALVPDSSINENLYLAYQKLYEDGIVKPDELDILKAWIKDIA